MEKTLSSLRSFVDVGGKAKFCVNCGNIATQEAFFNVDGLCLWKNTVTPVQKRG
jgi:hypothetical protein